MYSYLVLLEVCGVQYSKNPHKRTHVLGVQVDFVPIYWVFSANSALFLKIKHCIDYQQMKSMCKHNISIINGWN